MGLHITPNHPTSVMSAVELSARQPVKTNAIVAIKGLTGRDVAKSSNQSELTFLIYKTRSCSSRSTLAAIMFIFSPATSWQQKILITTDDLFL